MADLKASIAQDGRLDPAKLDVTEKPRRRRHARSRPAPSAELRELEKAAEARAHARPYPPGIILEAAGMDNEHWTSPHNDHDLWGLQLADAFGTRSRAVVVTFMGHLQALCGRDYWDDEAQQWRMNENHFSAAIALVNTVKPRNEMEAALAAQMVAVHLLTMKIAARALEHDYDNHTAATLAKLARTFTMQMDALRASQGKRVTAKQSIKVRKDTHQHVHYHDHREGAGTGGRPHGQPSQAVDQCAALPGPQQSGESMPLPMREGQGAVSHARRG